MLNRMIKVISLTFLLWTLPSVGSAEKENDPILASHKKDMSAVASHQADGTVKISVTVGRKYPTIAPTVVLYKAAIEAERAGFSRFAIIRQKFWSYYTYGQKIDSNAVVYVRFVKPGESINSPTPVIYVETNMAIAGLRKIFGEPDPSDDPNDKAK
ncbi:hypothetical protein [Sphingomonas bacterium]|uniref:hypothetical protein n=1 Tax=Sphingomonas bacterium TaxID=1895847 RepID=UPI0015756030|nr:hypothetical protein [Sphingomonas bacterium]